jgi:hypothetical protein
MDVTFSVSDVGGGGKTCATSASFVSAAETGIFRLISGLVAQDGPMSNQRSHAHRAVTPVAAPAMSIGRITARALSPAKGAALGPFIDGA